MLRHAVTLTAMRRVPTSSLGRAASLLSHHSRSMSVLVDKNLSILRPKGVNQSRTMSILLERNWMYDAHRKDRMTLTPHSMIARRDLLHIPLLGVLTPKVLAALAVKKTVVLAIIERYGVKGTFDILRATNDQMAQQLGSTTYPPTARNAVKVGLDALEMSVSKLEPKEQAEVVYKWLKSVDPNLIVESFRKYISTSPVPEKTATAEDKNQTEEEVKYIKEMIARFPEVSSKYHIVLVPKDPLGTKSESS